MSGANIKIGASSNEFQKQMNEVTRQLRLISSECGVAATKAKLFGSTQEQLTAKHKELTAKLEAQNQILKINQDRIVALNSDIEKEKKKRDELAIKLEEAKKKYEEVSKATGKESEESKKLKEEKDKLKLAYEKSISSISDYNKKLDLATVKLNDTEKNILQNKKALEDLNDELKNVKLDELSRKFEDLSEKANDVGSKMSTLSAGIVGAGTALTKMAFDTEQDLSTLSGRLGLTAEETENLKIVAKNLYNAGFGESLEDCVNDVVILQQNIKETSNMTNEQKGELLEQISTIKTLFGVESEEITKTLNNMLKNGIIEDLDEGLDLITKGFQEGLNSGGDLLDVLYEYSPQFKKLGLDGQEALSYIDEGLEAGGYNADKMADALKELSIRAIDGSDTTKEGFELMGKSADEMARKFAEGGDVAQEALNETIEGLKNIKDPIEQDLAGVNLFGTMWEDSSKEAILAMGNITDGLIDIDGATKKAGEEVNNSLGKQFTSVFREVKDAFLPFGVELLNLAKVGFPMLKSALESVTKFLNGLSDEGRKNILIIAGIVTAVGPTVVALGSFSKGISNIITGYKDMKEFGSKAIDVVKNFGSKTLDGAKAATSFATNVGKNMVSATINGAKALGNLALNLGKATVEFTKSALQASISAAKFIAHKTVTIASTVATTAMSAAQATLNFIMSLNPITLIIIGITALIAAIILLWNKCEWFRNLCMAMFEGLKAGWNATIEFFKLVWEGFVSVWNLAIEGLKLIWNGICEFFKLLWQGVCLYYETLWNAWKLVFEVVINAIKIIWQGVCDALKLAWQIIVDYIKLVWQGWKNIFQITIAVIKGIWDGFCNGLKLAWQIAINYIKLVWQGWKNIFQTTVTVIQGIWQSLSTVISSIWSGVVNGVKNAWSGIISPFQSVVNSITRIWEGIKSMFKLPHFNISGEFSLVPPKIPKVSVDWYYNGGIFKSPTVLGGIGVGDAFNGQGSNAEAIVPLDEMYKNIKGIVDNSSDGDTVLYITNVTKLDGEVISEKTTKQVIKKIGKEKSSRKILNGGGKLKYV